MRSILKWYMELYIYCSIELTNFQREPFQHFIQFDTDGEEFDLFIYVSCACKLTNSHYKFLYVDDDCV